jgi:uncharacterized OB-fold protein
MTHREPRTVARGLAPTIEGTRCLACGRMHVPARRYRCLGCGAAELAALHVPLRGVLESFTEHRDSVATAEGRVGLALVRLDAGPMLTAQLRIGAEPPRVGARVLGTVEAGDDPRQVRRRLRFALEA